MGHSSIRVTADTYGHLMPGANVDAIDRLDCQVNRQQNATQAQLAIGGTFEDKKQVVCIHGGPGGVRTLDLMTASHARSQLRHRPITELKYKG